MTRERTVTLGEALAELDERMDDLVAKHAEAEPDSAYAERLEQRAAKVKQQGEGVAHLVEHHGEDAAVTVAGLTAEMQATAHNVVADIRESTPHEHVPGSRRDVIAAVGLQDAPFLDGDEVRPGEDELDATLRALGQQPPGVATWLYSEVNDLSGGDGNFPGFVARLQAGSDAS